MNILSLDLFGFVSVDNIFETGATAVARNTDRIARFVSLNGEFGDEMVFADQREMTDLAKKIAQEKDQVMSHFGNSITLKHEGANVSISWAKGKTTHSLLFNKKDLLTQLDPKVTIKYLSS